MAQSGFTPILTYASNTAASVPSAGNLTNSANGAELAVNTADRRLFTKNSGGTVVELGNNPSALTVVGTTTLSALTASTALALNASKEVVSVTNTGSGNNVLATSPTLVTPALGTPSALTLTNATGLPLSTGVTGTLATTNGGTGLTSFTSGGVVYASSTSALATGSALTFDGTNLTNTGRFVVNVAGSNAGTADISLGALSGGAFLNTPSGTTGYLAVAGNAALAYSNSQQIWYASGSEQMRLTSTGLGIGTSSPGAKLEVNDYTNTSYTELVAFTGAKGLFFGIPTNQLAIVDSTAQAAGVGGEISLEGKYNSTDTTSFAAVGGVKENSTSGQYGGAFIVKTRVDGGNLTEKMRLDSSGNLGIGTSSPSQRLSVSGNANFIGTGVTAVTSPTVYFSNTTASTGRVYGLNSTDGGSFQIFDVSAGNATRVVLDSSGNLGVGTSSPAQLFHARKDQAAYTWARVDNQSSSASAYSGWMLGAFGNSWGMAIGSSAANSNALTWVIDAGGANTERMRLDSSGNLGLGVTPSAWVRPVIQVGAVGSVGNFVGTNTGLFGANFYFDNSSSNRYISDGFSGFYGIGLSNGQHQWYTAPSGTAGNAISFTQAMTLDASNNLLVGTTSASAITGFSGAAIGQAIQSVLPVLALVDSDDPTNYVTWLANSGGTGFLYTKGAYPLVLGTNGTERARITSGGNFELQGSSSDVGKTTPEMYGAVGNGVADDTTAVQNAVSSGKTVILTAGKTYRITSAISVTTNYQKIIGQGVLAPSGAINGVSVSGCTGVELALNFNSSAHSANYCVNINNANRVKITRLNIVDGFGAVYIQKANTVSIDWAWGTCRGPGIVWYGNASNRSDVLVLQNVVLGVGSTQYALDWDGDCHSLEAKYFGHIGGKGIIVRNTSAGPAPAIGRFTHVESDYSTACGIEIVAGLDIDITTPYVNGAASDGIKIGAAINDYQVRISGGKSIGNTGYGINNLGGVVLYGGTTDLSSNTSGESSGSLWTTVKRLTLDSQSYITSSGGNPLWVWDTNDYLAYDRTNNVFSAYIGSTPKLTLNSTGLFAGNGIDSASPSAGVVSATGGLGTNIAGASLTIRGGESTGSGAGGPIIFSTAAAGASGATIRNATERARITSTGNVVAGGSVALATTATDGFLYVPTCAGTPTGVPTAITGMAPIVVNTTNNKLYFYSGGAWRDAGP